jgi:hypothetical protein
VIVKPALKRVEPLGAQPTPGSKPSVADLDYHHGKRRPCGDED